MQSSGTNGSRGLTLAIGITAALLLLIGGVFLLEVFSFSEETTEEPLSVDEIEARAAALVAQGDGDRGETLIESYQCAACHVIGAENNIAPPFAGLAERAEIRKPSLSAAGYIYESIINPSAFLVEGFQNSMVQNFKDRVTEQDLADLMAYLMTRTSDG